MTELLADGDRGAAAWPGESLAAGTGPGWLDPPAARPAPGGTRDAPAWLRARVRAGDVVVGAACAAGCVGVIGPDRTAEAAGLAFALGWPAVASTTGQDRCLLDDAGFLAAVPVAARRFALCTAVLVAVLGRRLLPFLALGTPAVLVLSSLLRAGCNRRLERARARGEPGGRVVVAGDPRSVRDYLARRAPGRGRDQVLGVCCTRTGEPVLAAGAGVLGGVEALPEVLQDLAPDALVLLTGGELSGEQAQRALWAAEDLGLQVVLDPGLPGVAPGRLRPARMGGDPVLRVAPANCGRPARLAKAATDRGLAAVGLLLAGLPMLALALLVRATSPGPALFCQTRVGRNGREFRMLKLRSMRQGAEHELARLRGCNDHGEGPLFKMRCDPRVTPVGAWLRKLSLDELPQLVNVLRGQMSLVGPRPALPAEVARYRAPAHRRLRVKPGLTGLWQVSGRSTLSWAESIRLDLYYVDNWSPGADLVLLARTVGAVLRRDGAC